MLSCSTKYTISWPKPPHRGIHLNLKPGISVVIPNWNGERLLGENVPPLLDVMQQTGIAHEIIIADDCSTDGSVALIRTVFPAVKLVVRESNAGFAATANAGAARAEFDKLLLLNSDIRVVPGFLDPLLSYFSDQRTFAVSTKGIDDLKGTSTRMYTMVFRFGLFREKTLEDDGRPMPSMGASGGHGLFDTAKFRELGGFDELFSPFYWEDADLGYRAWKRGYKVFYEPGSQVIHRHQSTIGKLDRGYVQRVFFRNYLMLIWKNVTDSDLILQHLLLLPAFLLLRSLRRPSTLQSLFEALERVPQILRRRKSERSFQRLTDREVFAALNGPNRTCPGMAGPPHTTETPAQSGSGEPMISKIKRFKHKIDAILARDHDSFLSQVSGVIHVGANTGQERFRYWKHGLHVVWVEPIPEVFQVLKSNLRGFPKQRAIQCLLADQDGAEVDFHVASNNGESSSILQLKMHREAFPDITYEKTLTLRSRTLASLIWEGCPEQDRYDALMVDTQGSELLVLEGAAPVLSSFVYVKAEVSDFELYAGCCRLGDITSFMSDHGFAEVDRYRVLTCESGTVFDVVFKRIDKAQ